MMNRVHRIGFCLMAAAWLSSSGCSWMHRNRISSCRELTVVDQANTIAPLRVPPGLDAPDTRNAIKVPELNEPERPRLPTDPCLSRPPSYKIEAKPETKPEAKPEAKPDGTG
jgi:uncharacterized lipoprotein